jgi:Do/DeqQ family serine protease
MLANAMPAVVGVAVRGEIESDEEQTFHPDPFFHRFFGMPEGSSKQVFEAAGSGVIIDGDKGWILTNNHLVENAEDMMVVLGDGTHLVAEQVGRDPESDIAVIRVRHERLPSLPLGDSDTLHVGDWVVAIGNPFGLAQTATHGIVSGLGRSGLGIGRYEDFIQTDAPINPGNSGGALVDPQGRLVGLNTAIVGPASVGIGFAIPVNVAREAVKQIVEHGEVRRGHIGVVAHDLTSAVAHELGLRRQEGAAIVEVVEDSPAAKAGVLVGDVFLSLDGAPIRSSSDLRAKIGVRPLGDTLKVELWREGRTKTVDVPIGER